MKYFNFKITFECYIKYEIEICNFYIIKFLYNKIFISRVKIVFDCSRPAARLETCSRPVAGLHLIKRPQEACSTPVD